MYAIYIKYMKDRDCEEKIFMAVDINHVKDILDREVGFIEEDYFSDLTVSCSFTRPLGKGYFQHV